MEFYQTEQIPKPSKKLAVLSLIGICIAILVFSFVRPDDGSKDIAYLFGYKLPFSLLIWGLYRWLLGRSLSKSDSLIALIVLHTILVMGAHVSGLKQRAESMEMYGKIKTDFKVLAQVAPGQKIDTSVSTVPSHKGEVGEIEKLLREMMADMVKQRNDYFDELDATGWNKMLDSTRITSDLGLRETSKIVAAARNLVDKYEGKSRALIDGFPTKINALDVQESSKRDMIRGFEKAAGNSRIHLTELWSLERQVLVEVEAAVNVLGNSRGKWKFENKQFVFVDQHTLDLFNMHVNLVEELGRKQTDLQKRQTDKALAKFDRLTR